MEKDMELLPDSMMYTTIMGKLSLLGKVCSLCLSFSQIHSWIFQYSYSAKMLNGLAFFIPSFEGLQGFLFFP